MTDYLGPYELRGELGRGAMAIVWRAWDAKLEREVAVKEPLLPVGVTASAAEELALRFVREGKAAARLNHPGIVTIYAADVYDGRPAIVMELIDGETLSRLVERRITPRAAVGILDQLLGAVGYAHAHGVVHRDIKPDNIFITSDGRVKLADFGIAHTGFGAALTQTGTVMGTPGYMAPEQVTGNPVDGRADLFAIGVIGHEMLSGENPFGATQGVASTTIMYRIVHEPLPPLPPQTSAGLPVDLSSVLAVATAKDPAFRFPSAEAFRAALAGSTDPLRAPMALPTSAPAPSASRFRGSTIYVVVGAVMLVAVGLLFVLAGGGSGVSSGGASTSGGGATTKGTVDIASPSPGDSWTVGTPVHLAADVSAGVSTAASVVFMVNGAEVGRSQTTPYSVNYTPSSAGPVNVSAKLKLADGTEVSSDPIAVTVADASSGGSGQSAPAVSNGAGDVTTQVQAALDQWVQATVARDSVAEADAYAPSVSFFGKKYTNAQILQIKEKAVQLYFAKQDVAVRNVSITALGADRAEATFDKSWDFSGSKSFSGDERGALVFQLIGGSWKIVSEKELTIYWFKK